MAEEYLRQTLRLRPDFDAARLTMAKFMYDLRRFREAGTHYEALASRDDDVGAQAMLGWGMTMFQLGDFPRADSLLTKLVGSRPNDAQAWLSKGDALWRMGDKSGQARDAWRKAANVDPKAVQIAKNARQRLKALAP